MDTPQLQAGKEAGHADGAPSVRQRSMHREGAHTNCYQTATRGKGSAEGAASKGKGKDREARMQQTAKPPRKGHGQQQQPAIGHMSSAERPTRQAKIVAARKPQAGQKDKLSRQNRRQRGKADSALAGAQRPRSQGAGYAGKQSCQPPPARTGEARGARALPGGHPSAGIPAGGRHTSEAPWPIMHRTPQTRHSSRRARQHTTAPQRGWERSSSPQCNREQWS